MALKGEFDNLHLLISCFTTNYSLSWHVMDRTCTQVQQK
jgi:hypothetical protein